MNEQESLKIIKVGSDIANYALDKFDGLRKELCIKILAASVSAVLDVMHRESDCKNDKRFLEYMELRFLLEFREAMRKAKKQHE